MSKLSVTGEHSSALLDELEADPKFSSDDEFYESTTPMDRVFQTMEWGNQYELSYFRWAFNNAKGLVKEFADRAVWP